MAPTWFKRLGDIPGIEYEPPVPVDRSSLPNHDATPTLHRFEFEDGVRESLDWEYVQQDGEAVSSSGSPAHSWAFGGDVEERATSGILERTWEGLELPGAPSDYHFGIQGVAGQLWARKTEEPEVLDWVEYLYWLDIRLIRACPEAITAEDADERPGARRFYGVVGFHTLSGMYLREGFLDEARKVASIAAEFEHGEHDLAEIEERLALLRAEDGG